MIAESLVAKDRMNFVVRNCSERMLKILKTVCEEQKIILTQDQFPNYYINSLKQLSLGKVLSKETDDCLEQPDEQFASP
jgi:hypothetical protein